MADQNMEIITWLGLYAPNGDKKVFSKPTSTQLDWALKQLDGENYSELMAEVVTAEKFLNILCDTQGTSVCSIQNGGNMYMLKDEKSKEAAFPDYPPKYSVSIEWAHKSCKTYFETGEADVDFEWDEFPSGG